MPYAPKWEQQERRKKRERECCGKTSREHVPN
jgi:hypothetical protein